MARWTRICPYRVDQRGGGYEELGLTLDEREPGRHQLALGANQVGDRCQTMAMAFKVGVVGFLRCRDQGLRGVVFLSAEKKS